jgi:hypothetical protein
MESEMQLQAERSANPGGKPNGYRDVAGLEPTQTGVVVATPVEIMND